MIHKESAYLGYPLNGQETVKEVGRLSLKGDVTPSSWYYFILRNPKKDVSDSHAISILARIYFWHRPMQQLDHSTQQELPWRKKFAEALYRIDYQEFASYLHISERQVREAVSRLRKLGLIHLHLRYEEEAYKPKGTYVYIELCMKQISAISYLPEGVDLNQPKVTAPAGKVFRYGIKEALLPTYSQKTGSSPPTHRKTRGATHRKRGIMYRNRES